MVSMSSSQTLSPDFKFNSNIFNIPGSNLFSPKNVPSNGTGAEKRHSHLYNTLDERGFKNLGKLKIEISE